MPKSDAHRPPPANRLLAALPRRDYSRMVPRLAEEALEHAEVLFEPGETVHSVYFPESGIVSLVALMNNGGMAEAGMVGREGLVGLPVFLGTGASPFRAVVQVPGTARRMDAGSWIGFGWVSSTTTAGADANASALRSAATWRRISSGDAHNDGTWCDENCARPGRV